MLKMRKKIENRGMSLIEVIVSMLVLSIAVVTVMSAFSMASKTNLQSKRHQDVESVMESFLEYAEAGGTEYQRDFDVAATDYSVDPDVDGDGTKKKETLLNIKQGFGTYNVTVTTDTAPDKYTSGEFNNHDVIHFGGTGNNTVLIDASLEQNDSFPHNNISDADDTAHDYFWLWHSQAVDEYNDEHEDDAGFSEMPMIPLSNIGSYIGRELRIMTTEPEPNKMQLMASFVYTIDDGVKLPDSLSRTYSVLIYLSPVYDAGHVTTEGANKLEQVYIMYSDAVKENHSLADAIDIRIVDTEATQKRLHATFFLVNQEEVSESKTVNNAIGKNFEDRVHNKHESLTVSFKDPITGNPATPLAKLYSSINVNLVGEDANVTYNAAENAFNLVEKGNEVRVVTVTVEVADADTGTVIDTKTITRLQ